MSGIMIEIKRGIYSVTSGNSLENVPVLAPIDNVEFFAAARVNIFV
jgi:hypothetical protein